MEVARNTNQRASVIFEQNIMQHILQTSTNDDIQVAPVAAAGAAAANEGVEEMAILTDDVEDLDKEALIDYIESLRSIVRDKEIVCNQYKEQQVVMMDHLAQTNENLFQFFKIRYKVPGEKKKKVKTSETLE